MPPPTAQTYSDERLDDISREVYFSAMTQIKEFLDGTKTPISYEKMDTLAHVADAAACGFKPDEDEEI